MNHIMPCDMHCSNRAHIAYGPFRSSYDTLRNIRSYKVPVVPVVQLCAKSRSCYLRCTCQLDSVIRTKCKDKGTAYAQESDRRSFEFYLFCIILPRPNCTTVFVYELV